MSKEYKPWREYRVKRITACYSCEGKGFIEDRIQMPPFVVCKVCNGKACREDETDLRLAIEELVDTDPFFCEKLKSL